MNEILLSYPLAGTTNVNPQTEIITIFKHPFVRKGDVNIKVDGQWAVRGGSIQAGFRTTRLSESEGMLKWGVRCPGGLASRDILVQAWCFHDCSSVEQRFFVRGATTSATHHVKDNWIESGGTTFCSKQRPFAGGIEVGFGGKIGDDIVPRTILKKVMDARKTSNGWVLCSSDDKYTWVATPKFIHRYEFPSRKIKITDDWINCKVTSARTAHLPVGYQPSFNEKSSDDWFEFIHQGRWEIEFASGLHIWWNSKEMIAKANPNALTGQSDDILWTAQDMNVKSIESVKILNRHNVIVNDSVLVDTHNPRVEEV